MAKKFTKNTGLLSKLGNAGRKAFDAHKADETTYSSGGDLPGGIEAGVAQLVDCKFDVYKSGDNKGEYYFYAAGAVVEPKVHNGVPIEGLRTNIMEALCETPNRKRESIDDHMDWVLNELRKLGADMESATAEDLEDIASALKDEKPHFRFRTWQGEATKEYPNPRVNHDWRGMCEYDNVDGEAVEDNTESDEEEEEIDYVLLGQTADGGDDGAVESLTVAAANAGLDPDDYESWEDLGTALADWDTNQETTEEEEEEEETEEEAEEEEDETNDFEPQKEEIYFYKPPKARKQVECEVTAVFKKNQTCNLKSLDDGKIFKSVKWDELAQE